MRMRKGSRFDSRATTPTNRLLPLPNLALHDSKRGSDLVLAHGQGRDMKALGEMRSTERASPWKDAYSGLRFDNHF